MESLLVITGNAGKVAELSEMLAPDFDVVARTLEIDEIQSLSVETVVRDKARRAFEAVGAPVLVDDSGLELEALNGLPGALVAWFLKRLGPHGLTALIVPGAGRRGRVITALGFADQTGVRVFCGMVEGELSLEPRGEGGFGYDSIFIPDGHLLTFAEMPPAQKREASPRYLAVKELRRFLRGRAQVG